MDYKEKILDKLDLEDITLASNQSRLKAFVINDLLITLIILASVWDNIAKTNDTITAIIYLQTLAYEIMFIKIAYHTLFYWQYGATIGKKIAGIRVVDIDSLDNPNFLPSLSRSVIRVISEMFFYFGFIIAFFDPIKQTLQDKLAKTIVINAKPI